MPRCKATVFATTIIAVLSFSALNAAELSESLEEDSLLSISFCLDQRVPWLICNARQISEFGVAEEAVSMCYFGSYALYRHAHTEAENAAFFAKMAMKWGDMARHIYQSFRREPWSIWETSDCSPYIWKPSHLSPAMPPPAAPPITNPGTTASPIIPLAPAPAAPPVVKAAPPARLTPGPHT